MLNSDTLEHMLAQAASIGAQMHADDAAAESRLAQAKKIKGEASDSVTSLNRAASGYGSPRFLGIAAVAEVFGGHVNDPDTDAARDVAGKMATSYMTSYTASTAKTKAGGTEAGVARTILLGRDAKRLITGLQQRIVFWQSQRDLADQMNGEAAAEGKALREMADRYLILADSGNPKKGTPPKRKGRPAKGVNGVTISAAGGTNRMALLAYASGLVAIHGDAALHPDVLDAILDNGGMADKPEDGVAEIAAQARALLQRLESDFGGANTGDAAILSNAVANLSRIAQHGFKGEQSRGPRPPAAAAPVAPPPPPPPPVPAAAQQAPTTAAPPELLATLKLPEDGASNPALDALEAKLLAQAGGTPPATSAPATPPAKPTPPRSGRPPKKPRPGIG